MKLSKIRVLIVDDHAMVRAALRSLLETEDDFDVVGEASNGREALEAAGLVQPDVVLMDISMPGMNGLDATRELKQRAVNARVVAVTAHESEEYLFAMLEAGASGYVLKEDDPRDLKSALRAVHRGGVFVSPSVGKGIQGYHAEHGVSSSGMDLTAMQKRVLSLVAQGFTSHEVANSLSLSTKTVQQHRARIKKKLGIRSRSELVSYALQTGLI